MSERGPAMERCLGTWIFEGGGYVVIKTVGFDDTKRALDMVEKLVAMKREELATPPAAAREEGE